MVLNVLIIFGAVIGAVDLVFLRNRFGLGEKFQEGLLCLGSMALSMAGLMCIAPVLGEVLAPMISPAFKYIGWDPAMLGCVIANNMGGWPLARELHADPRMGYFFGLIVSSMLGATLVYTIPVGLGLLDKQTSKPFLKGILIGLATIPAGAIVGGLMIGISLGFLLWNMLPMLVLTVLLILGFRYRPEQLIRIFTAFSNGIQNLSYLALTVAVASYFLGFQLIPQMDTIENAMFVIADMGLVQLGCLPLMELLVRLLRKPLTVLGKRFSVDPVSVASIPIACVNLVSVFPNMKQMDRRGIVLVSAWATNTIAVFAAHLSYTKAVAPELVLPVVTAKLTSGVLALILANYIEKGSASAEAAA